MSKILLKFKRFSDSDLIVFAETVVANMKDNPDYALEAAKVTAVEEALTAFNTAVTDAADGGKTAKKLKDEKRAVLNEALQLLAFQLNMYLNAPDSFFTATGFELRKVPVRNTKPLPQAVIKSLRRSDTTGTVNGETVTFPDSVKEIAVEWSSDRGSSWKNGTYSTGKRFTIGDLPVKTECMIRVRFLGTRQRKGDWSDASEIFVL